MTKMVFVVEYTGQDEGCTMDVMQAFANHGYKLLEARFEEDTGEGIVRYAQDVMHLAKFVTPQEGKC